MKHIFLILIISIIFTSCKNNTETSTTANNINWSKRTINFSNIDSLKSGKTYISVYPQIYSTSQHRTHNLTVTISMRNVNLNDSIYIEDANYYNSKGELIKTYFNKPIYLAPLETVDIVIDENDSQGGTGANFIFNWKIKPQTNDPFFEGIMISTSGQQGLSFTTRGIKID